VANSFDTGIDAVSGDWADYLFPAAVPKRITKLEELGSFNSTLQENIVGINVVQLFRREHSMPSCFAPLTRIIFVRLTKPSSRLSRFSNPRMDCPRCDRSCAVVGRVICLARKVDFDIICIYFICSASIRSLRQFAEKFTAIQAGFTAVERLRYSE